MNLHEAKEKVRKLLNLADNDAAADLEIKNALAFARRLMLQHDIDESEVAEDARDPHEVAADTEYGEARSELDSKRIAYWECNLSSVITKLVGSVNCYRGGSHRAKTAHGTCQFDANGFQKITRGIVFYGPLEACESAADLYGTWRSTIIAMARLKHGGAYRGPGRSYCEGFVAGLQSKVWSVRAAERQQIAGKTEPMALVLRRALSIHDEQRALARDWLRDVRGITLVCTRYGQGGAHHAGAYGDGKRDGSRADLSRKAQRRISDA